MVCKSDNALIHTPNKRITSFKSALVDIYTFEISPYKLLPIAQVFRRDELPSLSSRYEQDYQRPLMKDKINKIREILRENHDFMFPNSVLLVLSKDCIYQQVKEPILLIPEKYGTVSVIDGQHRLFAYANKDIHDTIGTDAKIMITAVKFQTTDDTEILKYSASTFVEINTTQTPVRSSLLDAIAYSILGQETPRALSAEAILRLNTEQGATFGLFNTNQTSIGLIQTSTILTTLRVFFKLEMIRKLRENPRRRDEERIRGYKELYDIESIEEICDASNLLSKSVIFLKKYFGFVKSEFHRDWPKRNQDNKSSLKNAKMIAAFIRLLSQFHTEGLNWLEVQEQLELIRANLLVLRKMTTYKDIIFDPLDKENMPDAKPSVSEDFNFLNQNRTKQTSMRDVRVR